MKKIIQCFLSLKLTVTLLSLSMILVFIGTLAQVDKGIWTVMDQYFRTWVAWVDSSIFNPSIVSENNFRFPFPGGFLIGLLLSINLLVVHAKTFRVHVKGFRLWIGLGLLFFGLFITLGVVLGWGTASVAATEGDAFWRVFFRLGRGAIASLALFLACCFLYKNRAGIVLLHAGILLLLIGEFLTAQLAVESTMTIREGQKINYLDRSQEFELAFIDQSRSDYDWVTTIPKSLLYKGKTNIIEQLPFNIVVHDVMPNSRLVSSNNTPDSEKVIYPGYNIKNNEYFIAPAREVSGASGDQNAPAMNIELLSKIDNASLGFYTVSLWCYPNFVGQRWDCPSRVKVNSLEYIFYLRNSREYTQLSNGEAFSVELIDFSHEKYEGTQTPKQYSSLIRLINHEQKLDRTLKIWMNNPLRYAGLTFYQSGYLPDDAGTVLQVVRNDSWMIPYLSCMIVLVGMSSHFLISMKKRHTKINKNSEMMREK